MEINRGLDLKLRYKTARSRKKREESKGERLEIHISLLSVSPVVIIVSRCNERERSTLRKMARSLVCIKKWVYSPCG